MVLYIYLNIKLNFLIPAVVAQILNSTEEFAIATKEVKAEIETQPVIAEAKISKCLI